MKAGVQSVQFFADHENIDLNFAIYNLHTKLHF